MNKKLLCLTLAVVIVGTIFVSAYLASAAPQGKGNNRILEKRTFIHFRKGYGKPPGTPGGGGGKKPKEPKCYGFLGKGIKWKELSVDYVINPDNPDGLTKNFVTSAISTSAETWDTETTSELFNDKYTVDYEAQYGIQDFTNVISFGNYPQEGVIAVTIVWGYFSGPPSTRKIVEFDILFDIDFTWGDATSDPEVMDLQNIATHELGHGLGLADIYNCPEVTMYGYSGYGDTKKRTLEQPDITGIQELYGE